MSLTSRLLSPALALSLLCGLSVSAAVKPNSIISENMVLQQGRKLPIWGTADNGEKVSVTICGQTAATVAKDGKWMVWLKPLKVGGPYSMTIKGSNTIEYKNVLVGEVWICSGQSNMEMFLQNTTNAAPVIAASADPHLRLFNVPRISSDTVLTDVVNTNGWLEANPTTTPTFSAVGYFFGRELRKTQKVPVGLINSNVGGTPAEAWTSHAVLEKDPILRVIFPNHEQAIKDFPQNLERFDKAVAKLKAEGKPVPKNWRRPTDPKVSKQRPCGLYNAMIVPLEPYAIRGAIWYQGESNSGRAWQYRTLFPAMIKNWRKDWGYDLPFLFVQLAPFMKIKSEPDDSNWAELREAQLLTSQTLAKTAQAVITDVGEETDIHPKQKQPVGERLALAARAIAYGEKIEYIGPEFAGKKIDGDKIVLSFNHIGGGLIAKDGPLTGFTIAGADKKFFNAKAEIVGNKIVVCSDKVAKPVAVRFGWADFPVLNLWSKIGLPASPFRTDDWPGKTWPAPKKETAKK